MGIESFGIDYSEALIAQTPAVETFRDATPIPFTVGIPRKTWNRASLAALRFDFPDAVVPAAIGVSAHPRLLSYGFRGISFRQVASP